jgi:hypothetical protein
MSRVFTHSVSPNLVENNSRLNIPYEWDGPAVAAALTAGCTGGTQVTQDIKTEAKWAEDI